MFKVTVNVLRELVTSFSTITCYWLFMHNILKWSGKLNILKQMLAILGRLALKGYGQNRK